MADLFRFDVQLRVDQVLTAQSAGLATLAEVPEHVRVAVLDAVAYLSGVHVEAVAVSVIEETHR